MFHIHQYFFSCNTKKQKNKKKGKKIQSDKSFTNRIASNTHCSSKFSRSQLQGDYIYIYIHICVCMYIFITHSLSASPWTIEQSGRPLLLPTLCISKAPFKHRRDQCMHVKVIETLDYRNRLRRDKYSQAKNRISPRQIKLVDRRAAIQKV